jgi:hypothetical protein
MKETHCLRVLLLCCVLVSRCIDRCDIFFVEQVIIVSF